MRKSPGNIRRCNNGRGRDVTEKKGGKRNQKEKKKSIFMRCGRKDETMGENV
jgi:hypothetical protein